MAFVVYMATCLLSGGRYIGATSRGLPLRKRQHEWDAIQQRPGCRVLNAAIRKYGFESFQWTILAISSSFAEMMKEEIRLIANLKPEYNITRGGQGIIGLKRTPEWLAKTSAALKGRKPSPQCYAAIDPTKRFKPIVCLNDGVLFAGIRLAAERYGVTSKGIGEALHGRQAKCGGMSFVYSSKPLSERKRRALLSALSEKAIAAMSKRKSRSVICLSDDTVYPSAVNAAAIYRITPSRVMQLCQSCKASPAGLAFQYADLAEAA